MVEVEVLLQRWSDPEARQWYSGDTHLHRTVDELRTVILAEDLNVALPLTSWVTIPIHRHRAVTRIFWMHSDRG